MAKVISPEREIFSNEEFLRKFLDYAGLILLTLGPIYLILNFILSSNAIHYFIAIFTVLMGTLIQFLLRKNYLQLALVTMHSTMLLIYISVFVLWGGNPAILLAGFIPIVFLNLIVYPKHGLVLSTIIGIVMYLISFYLASSNFVAQFKVIPDRNMYYFAVLAGIVISIIFISLVMETLGNQFIQSNQYAEKYKILLDESPHGIAITDDRGQVLDVNLAFEKYTGIAGEIIVNTFGNPFMDISHRDLLLQYFRNIIKYGSYAIHTDLFRIGKVYYFELTGKKLGDGRVLHQIRDLTLEVQRERKYKLVEEALINSQKFELVGKIAGRVAHDFNNILTAILNYTDISLLSLEDGNLDPNFLEEIKRITFRGSSITKSMLSAAGKRSSEVRSTDINREILQRKEMIESLIGPSIHLELYLADEISNIYVDEIQFEQLLLNVILNSRDAINTTGKIVLSTCIDTLFVTENDLLLDMGNETFTNRYVVLSIEDSGLGITQDQLTHVFDPFFTKKTDGTGLGLYIVRSVMEECGGFIKIQSEEGLGTKLSFYFIPSSDQTLDEVYVSYEKPPWLNSVMLIDDQEDVRESLLTILKKYNIDVTAAANGLDAINMILEKDLKVDLIITDLVMPKLRGDGFIDWYRDQDRNTPVVLMSAYDLELPALKTLYEQDEKVFVLTKPYRIQDIFRVLNEI